MQRYGQLTPIVLNTDAIRQRLNLPPEDQPAPMVAQGGPTTPQQWPVQFSPYGPTPPAAQPRAAPGSQPDRTIYDTARRIGKWLKH
jgi:hypothetical protein